MSYRNFFPKMNRFLDIRLRKMSRPWNLGQRSLKVIGTNTDRSATCDFLLTIHRTHVPISYYFRDGRRFQSKIAKFSHPRVFCPLSDGVTLGIGYRRFGQKNRNDGTTRWLKNFQDSFSRLDTIPACDIHPASHVATAIAALCYASREQKCNNAVGQ